jgi:hypothetical protein
MYMYIPCTYMFMSVCQFMNIYVHVCTMFRHVCTVLPILVQVVRIPDVIQDVQVPILKAGGHTIQLLRMAKIAANGLQLSKFIASGTS